ncbi:hypothetical protein [Streptomyces sp. 8L]|uniref:hypothetical protein n=1 Tax=Streptomyces sp. 8L TaxID=2877242 RepID=UPI001CD79DD2|nr:hypothetical protein [Streptomyces sp. 8L]MCA1219976.1 hypothetical protein [Streptomyces sp. 8L]
MISEPELEGEDWPERPSGRPGPAVPGQRDGGLGAPGESGPVVVGDGMPAPAPRRAALRWGLGGALVASLLWCAGLTLYHSRSPDLGGYGAERDLCLDAPLTALSKVLGPAGTPEAASDETEAVDSAQCRTDLGRAPRGSPFHTLVATPVGPHGGVRTLVNLSYVLHRSTDPAPEFDALPQPKSPGWALHTVRVPGLGDRAYLITDSVGDMPPTLRVLDGRAEFTLTLRVYSSYDGNRADPSEVRAAYVSTRLVATVLAPAMKDDMRALMKTVKAGG